MNNPKCKNYPKGSNISYLETFLPFGLWEYFFTLKFLINADNFYCMWLRNNNSATLSLKMYWRRSGHYWYYGWVHYSYLYPSQIRYICIVLYKVWTWDLQGHRRLHVEVGRQGSLEPHYFLPNLCLMYKVQSTWWIEWIANRSIAQPSVYCPVIGQGTSEIMIAAFITIVTITNLFIYYTQKTPATYYSELGHMLHIPH